jgi:hypothetical protein
VTNLRRGAAVRLDGSRLVRTTMRTRRNAPVIADQLAFLRPDVIIPRANSSPAADSLPGAFE